MPHSFIHSAVKWTGIALQAAAAIWLLGWLQGNDSGCGLETAAFVQTSMCDPETEGAVTASPTTHLFAIFLLFVFGYLCTRVRSEREDHAHVGQLPEV